MTINVPPVRAKASQETEESAYLETLLDGAGDLTPARRSAQDDTDREGSLQIDYTRPLGALRFDAGYKGDWQALGSTLDAETADADGASLTSP